LNLKSKDQVMATSVNKQRCKLDIQLIITVVNLIGLVGMVFLQITWTNKEGTSEEVTTTSHF